MLGTARSVLCGTGVRIAGCCENMDTEPNTGSVQQRVLATLELRPLAQAVCGSGCVFVFCVQNLQHVHMCMHACE